MISPFNFKCFMFYVVGIFMWWMDLHDETLKRVQGDINKMIPYFLIPYYTYSPYNRLTL